LPTASTERPESIFCRPRPSSRQPKKAVAEPQDKEQLNVLRGLFQQSSQPHLGALFDVDLTDPKDAGGRSCSTRTKNPAVKAAFQPLVNHRRKKIANDNMSRNSNIATAKPFRSGWCGTRWGSVTSIPERVPFLHPAGG